MSFLSVLVKCPSVAHLATRPVHENIISRLMGRVPRGPSGLSARACGCAWESILNTPAPVRWLSGHVTIGALMTISTTRVRISDAQDLDCVP
jgi:hypothetical protein